MGKYNESMQIFLLWNTEMNEFDQICDKTVIVYQEVEGYHGFWSRG